MRTPTSPGRPMPTRMRWCPAAMALVVGVAIGTTAFAGVAFGAPTWTTPASITHDTNTNTNNVSCISATFCAVVGGQGAQTYTSGTWSIPAADGGLATGEVSCTTSTFCMAVDSGGNALTYSGGTNWTPANIDSHALISVSCPIPSTTFCVAVDGAGNALTYGSGTWTTTNIDGTTKLTGVSCPTTTFCVAVDSVGNALTYSSGTWTTKKIDTLSGGLSYVSCPTTGFCAATGSLYTLTDNDGAWTTPDLVFTNTPSSVSCATASFCVAIGAFNYSIFDGVSWSLETKADSGVMTSVSCAPTITFCMAVDESGDFVIYGSSTGPPPMVPETPAAILLPVLALGVVGTSTLWVRRRRRNKSPAM